MTYNFKHFYVALRRLETARQHVLRTPTGGNPSLALLKRHKQLCKRIDQVEKLIYFFEVESACTPTQE